MNIAGFFQSKSKEIILGTVASVAVSMKGSADLVKQGHPFLAVANLVTFNGVEVVRTLMGRDRVSSMDTNITKAFDDGLNRMEKSFATITASIPGTVAPVAAIPETQIVTSTALALAKKDKEQVTA